VAHWRMTNLNHLVDLHSPARESELRQLQRQLHSILPILRRSARVQVQVGEPGLR